MAQVTFTIKIIEVEVTNACRKCTVTIKYFGAAKLICKFKPKYKKKNDLEWRRDPIFPVKIPFFTILSVSLICIVRRNYTILFSK